MKPPPWLDRLVSLLLPPDARECVLGDLYERLHSTSPSQISRRFLRDGLSAIPAAVSSRLRRTVGWRQAFAEVLVLSTLFLVSAFSVPRINGLAFFASEHAFLRLLIPAIVTFVVMTVLDVYASWDPQDLWDQFAVVAASLAGAVLVNAVLDRTWSHWALPRGMMPWAVAMVFALLSVTRWIGRQQVAPAPCRREPMLGLMLLILTAGAFLRMALTASEPIVRVGAYLTVAPAVLLAWQLYRPRTRDAVLNSWWRAGLLLPGPILVTVGRALEHPNVLPAAVAWILVFVLLLVASVSLNHRVERS